MVGSSRGTPHQQLGGVTPCVTQPQQHILLDACVQLHLADSSSYDQQNQCCTKPASKPWTALSLQHHMDHTAATMGVEVLLSSNGGRPGAQTWLTYSSCLKNDRAEMGAVACLQPRR